MRRLLASFVLLSLVVGGCADDATPSTTGPTTTAGAGGIADEVAGLVDEAERVRGLEFFDEPAVEIISQEELSERVRQQIEDELEPEDVAVLQRLYELLGLLDGTIDLGQAYQDLYAEQVGGYYDHETGDMVISGGSSLSALSKTIVVHELVHALTDEQYGFADRSDDLVDADQFEEAFALQALTEGDATYFQIVYLQGLSAGEQQDAIVESLAVDTSVTDSLPGWFAEDLTFPYDAGFGFVTRLVQERGTRGVNQAYEQPPTTTEQILHPEKYFIREPARDVVLPSAEVAGYEQYEEGIFGEWNQMLYLLDGVSPGDAVVGATGWGGDHYRIYWNGTDVVFAYLYEGDTPRDAEEFADYLVDSVSARLEVGSAQGSEDVTTFPGGSAYAYVELSGQRVLFVAGFDSSLGSALVQSLLSGGALA
ncbi:MAG: hypothetical protein Q8Q29_05300 [Actinomycetota bacterium]|nr:hypothetical protein [Actinomycetota bacterium]